MFAVYAFLLLLFWHSWAKTPVYTLSSVAAPTTTISVIIPARNEANKIGRLLSALQQQSYPKHLYEVIVVDDHSTDNTASIVRENAFAKLLQLKEDAINSYKKKAIEKGIAAATGKLIVTTDADCTPGKEWLSTVVAFKEERNAVFIAAPVVMEGDNSLLEIFQAMDFMILQAITGAVVHKKMMTMCNGANLAYERHAFYTVNGYNGIDHIASGDDLLLMHKIAQHYPTDVYYLKAKEAIITTQPEKNWNAFWNQRIRWSSKARFYKDKRITLVLLLVYLFNLSFPVLFIAGFFSSFYWLVLGGLLLAKVLVEIPLFMAAGTFFNKSFIVKWFPFFQPLHIFYTLVAGLLGSIKKYSWKGRIVK